MLGKDCRTRVRSPKLCGLCQRESTGQVYNMRIKKSTFIEKFKGDFNKVDGGCTVIHTKSAQLITDFFLLGIYTYLASKPPEWKINVRELMAHGKCGRDKTRKALSDLCMIGLLERKDIRDKGMFVDYEYYLYLSPEPENQSSVQPEPEKPGPGSPEPENQGTYKEEILKPYKEENIKKYLSLTQTSNPKVNPEDQDRAHEKRLEEYRAAGNTRNTHIQ